MLKLTNAEVHLKISKFHALKKENRKKTKYHNAIFPRERRGGRGGDEEVNSVVQSFFFKRNLVLVYIRILLFFMNFIKQFFLQAQHSFGYVLFRSGNWQAARHIPFEYETRRAFSNLPLLSICVDRGYKSFRR